MDNERALEIINTLASGFDPFTGEVYDEENVLQNPDVVRALFTAARALEGLAVHATSKSRNPNLPANAGRPWSEEESQQLAAEFDSGKTQAQLVESHERTPGAIRSRLVRLGKLEIPEKGNHG